MTIEALSRSSVGLTLDRFYRQKAGEIGLNDSEVEAILNRLNIGTLSNLLAKGWNINELKDLLDVVFNANDKIKIGVFGSMSRSKVGIAPPTTKEPSDMDILIVTSPSCPENVSITEYPGSYSERKIRLFMVKEPFVEAMLGKRYPEIKWVYKRGRYPVIPSSNKKIYHFMYGC